MSPIESILAELPNRSEWQEGFAALRNDIRGLRKPARPRSFRAAAGPRVRVGFGR